jgi:hypothetical protein
MKRLARFVSPAVLGLASLPLACFSKSDVTPLVDSGTPPLVEDSGLRSAQDATTTPPFDAGSRDAATDAGTPPVEAAAPGPLTVTVLMGGAPESGVLVVFQDATGGVLTTATTDATGTVSQLVTAGSQVTAALGTAQTPNLVTVQDVENGDMLTLVDSPSTNLPGTSEPVTVTLPATTWDAGTNVAIYAGGCSDPAAFDIYLQPTCTSQGTFPLFARAADATGEIAYTYQTRNAVDPDGGPLAITVSRPWSTSTATQTIEASSLPTVSDDAGVSLGTVTFDYSEVAGGVPLALLPVVASVEEGGPPNEEFVIHPGYPDFTQQGAYVLLEGVGSDSEVFAVTRTAPVTASQTTSIALGTLPGFTGAAINANDAGSPTQPVVTWTTTGSLSAANGVFTMLQWYAPPPDGGSQDIAGTWTIVSPATATSVEAPSVPASAAAFAPPSTARYNPPRVVAVQSSSLAGYSGYKSQFATIPVFTPGGNWQPAIPLLPADGFTLYVSAIYPDEG